MFFDPFTAIMALIILAFIGTLAVFFRIWRELETLRDHMADIRESFRLYAVDMAQQNRDLAAAVRDLRAVTGRRDADNEALGDLLERGLPDLARRFPPEQPPAEDPSAPAREQREERQDRKRLRREQRDAFPQQRDASPQHLAEQQRAEQQRAEQQRAEQQRAEQQRAEQERAEQQRAERERAEQVPRSELPRQQAVSPAPRPAPLDPFTGRPDPFTMPRDPFAGQQGPFAILREPRAGTPSSPPAAPVPPFVNPPAPGSDTGPAPGSDTGPAPDPNGEDDIFNRLGAFDMDKNRS